MLGPLDYTHYMQSLPEVKFDSEGIKFQLDPFAHEFEMPFNYSPLTSQKYKETYEKFYKDIPVVVKCADWALREAWALPFALKSIIQIFQHTLAILNPLQLLNGDTHERNLNLKKNCYKVLRDVEETLGHLVALVDQIRGNYWVEDALLHKDLYDEEYKMEKSAILFYYLIKSDEKPEKKIESLKESFEGLIAKYDFYDDKYLEKNKMEVNENLLRDLVNTEVKITKEEWLQKFFLSPYKGIISASKIVSQFYSQRQKQGQFDRSDVEFFNPVLVGGLFQFKLALMDKKFEDFSLDEFEKLSSVFQHQVLSMYKKKHVDNEQSLENLENKSSQETLLRQIAALSTPDFINLRGKNRAIAGFMAPHHIRDLASGLYPSWNLLTLSEKEIRDLFSEQEEKVFDLLGIDYLNQAIKDDTLPKAVYRYIPISVVEKMDPNVITTEVLERAFNGVFADGSRFPKDDKVMGQFDAFLKRIEPKKLIGILHELPSKYTYMTTGGTWRNLNLEHIDEKTLTKLLKDIPYPDYFLNSINLPSTKISELTPVFIANKLDIPLTIFQYLDFDYIQKQNHSTTKNLENLINNYVKSHRVEDKVFNLPDEVFQKIWNANISLKCKAFFLTDARIKNILTDQSIENEFLVSIINNCQVNQMKKFLNELPDERLQALLSSLSNESLAKIPNERLEKLDFSRFSTEQFWYTVNSKTKRATFIFKTLDEENIRKVTKPTEKEAKELLEFFRANKFWWGYSLMKILKTEGITQLLLLINSDEDWDKDLIKHIPTSYLIKVKYGQIPELSSKLFLKEKLLRQLESKPVGIFKELSVRLMG